MAILGPVAVEARAVQLASDTDVASAGFFQLTWTAGAPVVLEESTSSEFASARVIYTGADTARVMSGKRDGDWYYRARTTEPGSGFSNVVKVSVRHHPLQRAFAFFALGALVFLATLFVIVKGARSGS